MVSSYDQNPHFKVQCQKFQRQNCNSVHYIFDTTDDSYNNMYFSVLLAKTPFELQQNSMFCGNEMKTTK
jgi:hypothetical protein